MKKTISTHTDALLAGYAQHFAGLKQELEKVSYFCKGTVLEKNDEVRTAALCLSPGSS